MTAITLDQFYNKFEVRKDARAIFWTKGQSVQVNSLGTFTDGIAFQKYKNIKSDGNPGKAQGFVDTDFPMMRYADVLLMAAECSLYPESGISHSAGLGYLNQVRARAGVRQLKNFTADNLLDERARELYLELWRRQDLVRFDKFTSGNYLWDWKGGVRNGTAVEDYKNLYPIPTSDKMVNSNLVQNPGYEK